VLGGLIQGEDRKNRSTVPILGDIPYLGELLTATTVDRVETEVVLTITPRIVRSLTTPPIADQAFWSGTDQNYATTQLFPPRARTVSQSIRTNSPATASGVAQVEQFSSTGTAESTGVVPSVTSTLQETASLNTRGASPAGEEPAGSAAATQPGAPSIPLTSTPVAASASATTPSNETQGASSSSELPARGPGRIAFNASDVSAMVGQEFRVDLSTVALESLSESLVTVSYDPKLLEYRRVGPGAAAISARAMDGQVLLTVRRQGTTETGSRVLAMLFFQAKAKGDATLTMGVTPNDGALPASTGRAVVHVQ
jgi:general secretion pathway protein D